MHPSQEKEAKRGAHVARDKRRAHSLLAPSGPLGLPPPPSTPMNWYMSVMLKTKLKRSTWLGLGLRASGFVVALGLGLGLWLGLE